MKRLSKLTKLIELTCLGGFMWVGAVVSITLCAIGLAVMIKDLHWLSALIVVGLVPAFYKTGQKVSSFYTTCKRLNEYLNKN